MANSTSPKPREKHWFSERHVRGWIVIAIIIVDLLIAVRAIVVAAFLGAAGDVTDLAVNATPLYVTVVVLLALAIIVASRRVSGFTLALGHTLAIKLHLVERDRRKHSGKSPKSRKDVKFPKVDKPIVDPGDDETGLA